MRKNCTILFQEALICEAEEESETSRLHFYRKCVPIGVGSTTKYDHPIGPRYDPKSNQYRIQDPAFVERGIQ